MSDLLSFMCILVTGKLDSEHVKTMSHGEIYTRMIQCLYKKFHLCQKIPFKDEQFFKVVKSLGKLALESLVSGDPLFKRSRVVKEVGEEVFDYGLLIGNEDVINDLVADISYHFPSPQYSRVLGCLLFCTRAEYWGKCEQFTETQRCRARSHAESIVSSLLFLVVG